MRYIAFIYEEDEGYSALVPDLKGCFTCGDTFEETCKYIQEASELWLEDEKFPKPNEFKYFTDKKRKVLDVPQNAMPIIVDIKQDKNVRINVILNIDVVKLATDKAKVTNDGNRSAYIQSLIEKDNILIERNVICNSLP